MNQDAAPEFAVVEGHCAGSDLCPLSCVQAGATVCIKHLSAAPDVTDRLRELGLGEQQRVKVIARESSFICQVCNARIGLSRKLADSILVEAPQTASL